MSVDSTSSLNFFGLFFEPNLIMAGGLATPLPTLAISSLELKGKLIEEEVEGSDEGVEMKNRNGLSECRAYDVREYLFRAEMIVQ